MARTRRCSAASPWMSYAFHRSGKCRPKDVAAYALMVGVAGEARRWNCQCGERLPKRIPRCAKACGTRYKRKAID